MHTTAATSLTVRSVELPTGVRLQYVERGDPAGVPVVLLHGITDSWRSFEPVLPHLPDAVRAFALTQRGHGDASKPAEGYRPSDFAADVAAFMDALGIERAVVVGHSMGGSVAQRFAVDFPERTLGIVLVASFRAFQGNPTILEFREAVAALGDPIDPAFALEFQRETLARPVPEPFLEMVVAESLKAPSRVWRSALEGLLEDSAARDVPKIAAPALVVAGELDAFVAKGDPESLAAAIAGARLVTYAGAGHAVHWEEPERFAADLAAFAASL